MDDIRPKRYWLLSCPRTASNLLLRILNLDEQPSIAPGKQRDYFFIHNLKWQAGDELCCKPLKQWSQAERDGLLASFQSGFDDLQALVKDCEAQGKDVWVKEHTCFLVEPVAQCRFLHGTHSTDETPWTVKENSEPGADSKTNPTALPDEFLKTWRPTFLIRHPAVVFPSFQRVTTDIYGEEKAAKEHIMTFGSTLHWSRIIYDWFRTQQESVERQAWPIVLDADDFIADAALARKYSNAIGLDASELKFTWEAVGEEALGKMPPTMKTMGSSLFGSAGVLKTRSPREISIEDEAKKWRQEFGDDVAAALERRVRAAMPDYEYLYSRRFRGDAAED